MGFIMEVQPSSSLPGQPQQHIRRTTLKTTLIFTALKKSQSPAVSRSSHLEREINLKELLSDRAGSGLRFGDPGLRPGKTDFIIIIIMFACLTFDSIQ